MSKATDTIKFLTVHNSWRRGDETIDMQDPTEIGAAIDDAVNLLRRYDELEKENQRLRNIISAIRYTTDVEPDLSQAAIIEKVGDYCDQVLGKQEIE